MSIRDFQRPTPHELPLGVGSWRWRAGTRAPPRPPASSSTSPFVDEIGDEARPAGLVIRAESGTVVAVEVFVEQQQIAPVRILLELLRAAVDAPAARLVAREHA